MEFYYLRDIWCIDNLSDKNGKWMFLCHFDNDITTEVKMQIYCVPKFRNIFRMFPHIYITNITGTYYRRDWSHVFLLNISGNIGWLHNVKDTIVQNYAEHFVENQIILQNSVQIFGTVSGELSRILWNFPAKIKEFLELWGILRYSQMSEELFCVTPHKSIQENYVEIINELPWNSEVFSTLGNVCTTVFRNSIIFIQDDAFGNVVCQNSGIFFRGRWAN